MFAFGESLSLYQTNILVGFRAKTNTPILTIYFTVPSLAAILTESSVLEVSSKHSLFLVTHHLASHAASSDNRLTHSEGVLSPLAMIIFNVNTGRL